MKQAIRNMKKELAFAAILSISLLALITFINMRNLSQDSQNSLETGAYKKESLDGPRALTSFEQVIRENIVGELQKGSFETVVKELRNLTSVYGGRIPSLQMYYTSDLWKGELECKIPTDNVATYTFDVRDLITNHGKVTYISIGVGEVEVNGTAQQQETISDVSISLKEIMEGGQLPFLSQLGAVVPLLTTSLVWIAQALIITIPLSFALLAIIIMIEKGLVPLWKRQFKTRKTNTSIGAKPAT